MSESTFYNKKRLCYTDTTDFTNYKGVGSDPMYMRYDSVYSVIANNINPKYRHFLAQPQFVDGNIHWYVDVWNDVPKNFCDLTSTEKAIYEPIKNETLKHYRDSFDRLTTEELSILGPAIKDISDEFIYCYDGKVVAVAWGMTPDGRKRPVDGRWVKGIDFIDTCTVTFDPGEGGSLDRPQFRVLQRPKGSALTSKDVPNIICKDGYTFNGWLPLPNNLILTGDVVFKADYNFIGTSNQAEPELIPVHFACGPNGILDGKATIQVPAGSIIPASMLPTVRPDNGFEFSGWDYDITSPIYSETTFTACFTPGMVSCTFLSGDLGTIQGENVIWRPIGYALQSTDIPTIQPMKGYKFTGWDINPLGLLMNGDVVLTAQYAKKKSSWAWLKWLLWFLLGLLLLLLLLLLLGGCSHIGWPGLLSGCTGCTGLSGCAGYEGVEAVETIVGDDGIAHDINGPGERDIVGDDGELPENSEVPSLRDEDGRESPIEHNDGAPDVVANRLNIFFESDDPDMNQWARDFKAAYPGEKYTIIGSDPNVKMIVIRIPENERNRIREELPTRLSHHKFFVFDESIMTLNADSLSVYSKGKFDSDPLGQTSNAAEESDKGWHLKATHVSNAHQITKGKSDIILAIVDDGIDPNHSIFEKRFRNAYNVFTKNNKLSKGSGHGTHVAALAAGSDKYYADGASGVAPNVKIMPVQVFDNGNVPFSALASGIMYAIHNGADVVNVSVGPSFDGLDALTPEQQRQIVNQYFINEQNVFRHIIKVANEKNVILVFAAGNDNILSAILPECRMPDKTINVAAVNKNICATEFTNYSKGTNISAPGKSIYSAMPGEKFGFMDGTSQAAPMVAGTVALMRSIKPDLTVGQVIGVLQQTGKPTDGDNRYVPPMIQIDRALTAVKNGQIPDGPVFDAQLPPDGNYIPSPDYVDPGVNYYVDPATGYYIDPGSDYMINPVDGSRVDRDYAIAHPIIGTTPGNQVTDPTIVAANPAVGGTNPSTPDNNNSYNPGNGSGNGGGDSQALQDLLKQLIKQRDDLNKRIDELKGQIGK